jgi:hypothetical protein
VKRLFERRRCLRLAVAGGADTGISFYALAPAFTGGVSVRTGP